MPFAAVEMSGADLGAILVALAGAEGSAAHGYTHSGELNAGARATRNLADALHLFSLLHGPQPGLIERAAERNPVTAADGWFLQAAAGFAAERAYLAELGVVAGPPPSTPGEAETVATLLAQRHAFEVMATSDRIGCAIGATAALLLDWQAVRAVLDTAVLRLGGRVPPLLLPNEAATAMMLAGLPEHPRLERTLTFGARQLLAQHYGLWDLLEVRAAARPED